MCNATIQLEVTWRIPNVFRARKRRQARAHAPAPVQGQQPPVGNQWRNADLPVGDFLVACACCWCLLNAEKSSTCLR